MKLIFTFLLIPLCSCLFAQTFTEVPSFFPDVANSSVSIIDVNGDQTPDILIIGVNSSSERIANLYINDGQGNFTEVSTPFEGVDNGSISIADLNDDQSPDVIITGINNSFDRIAKLYINDGQGNFTEVPAPFKAIAFGSVSIADVNGDKSLDVLIAGAGIVQAIAKLYTNDGQGNFTEVSTPFEGVFNGSISIADVNGDQSPDVLITGANISFVPMTKLYINDGQGNFTEVSIPFEGVAFSSVSITDLNGDQSLDVLITGLNDSRERISKLYANDGQGNFTEVSAPFDGVEKSSLSIADINGDQSPDVLIAGRNGSKERITKLYTNDGQGNFTEVSTSFDGISSGSVSIADINGDQHPDVFITGQIPFNSQISKLYINDGTTSINGLNDFSGISSYTLSPNPVENGVVNIQVNIKQSSRTRINLYDVLGQRLGQQEEELISGENTVLFDVSKLEKGTYLIEIENGQGRGVQKLIIL